MPPKDTNKPIIVTLCGSTRFKAAFEAAMRAETLAGNIVLTVGLFGHLEGFDMDGPTKRMLDELHLRKIDLSSDVLFLNVRRPFCPGCDRWCDNDHQTGRHAYPDGHTECCGSEWEMRPYVGESTRRELAYARAQGKVIRFLESTTEA
jgi:hypothetical protein